MDLSHNQPGAQFMLANNMPVRDDLASRACPADDPDVVYRKQLFALVPTVIIMVLSITTYSLRLFCRRKTGQRLWWDDYLMGVGLLISLEPSICEFLLAQNGLGHHICNVPKDQAARFSKITFALQRANQPALFCIKTSILLFYMRIFTTRRFRIAAYCVMAYHFIWAVSSWAVNLTVCTPVAYYYDRTIPGGHCRNQAMSGSINGGLSLLGDVMVLVLPMPAVWGLRINARKKAGITGVFLLGVFVCAASVVRIVELARFVVADPTFTQVHASAWTTLEQGVAVISGNLPLLAPLFERYLRGRGSYGSGSGGGSGWRYGSGSKGRRANGSPPGDVRGGTRTSRFNNPTGGSSKLDYTQTTTTTITAAHDPYRLSDEESQTHTDGHSAAGIELDDRAILVKTQFVLTEDDGRDKGTGGGTGQAQTGGSTPELPLEGRKSSTSWLQK